MARAQPADNPRVVAHTYQQHPQPYNHGPAQHPPNHAYQHHQEVQIVPPPLPPPHPQQQNIHHPQAPKQEDFADQPYRGVIYMITGGSSADFDTKREKRDNYRSINHIAVTGPVVQTKWSHVPLTFNARDVDLRSAPHIDGMVINCSVAGWDLHKVLVDNGSQADIIFLHAFDRMGISHSLLKPSDNPLYGFGGKGTFPVGKIEPPLSFGVAPNAQSEKVTFDIVDMVYPYNAIMGRGSIKFEAAIHGLYMFMKIPGPQGAITVYINQQATCNIERDFVPGQRNVHCLTAQREVLESASPTAKEHEKAQLQSNDGTKTVPLDQATPKQTVIISEDLTSHDEERLLCCLSKNKDVFAWSALDLVGVSRSIIEHSLGIDPSVRPKKQRLRKMSDEKIEATKTEIHCLLEANFIEPVAYPTWLANVVMVQKKSGKWRMCIDFTSLNKACPKDNFPLPRIDKIVDSAAGCEVMSLLDFFFGYHQIYMKEEDKASTSFITPFDTYCFIRMPEGLKNAGSTFSRLTKMVLESQVGRNIFTYVDNIVVASRSKEDHLADLAETFANMRDARLRLNPEKCIFGVRQGKILGYLVSHRGIEANPTKIQAIINMTPPAVSQRRRTTDRHIGRPQQIHLQVRRAKPTFPKNTPRRKRLRMGTRASGSLRFTKIAPVRVGDSYKPQPLATPVALHRNFAARGQHNTGSRVGQRGHDQAMSSVLCLRSTHDIKMQHDGTGKSRLRSCYGFAQIAPLF
jgi:hypothetical protein